MGKKKCLVEFTIREIYGNELVKVDRGKNIEPEEAVTRIKKFMVNKRKKLKDEFDMDGII